MRNATLFLVVFMWSRGSNQDVPIYEYSSEFLTGFHKRKQERTEQKKARRIEREKQERLEARRQVSDIPFKIKLRGGELSSAGQNRQMLAERATENAAQVEAAYGGKIVDELDAQGPDSEGDMIQEEYENEEHVATVTVVEDFDIDALIHPEPSAGHPNPGPSSNQDQDGRPERRAAKPKATITSRTPRNKSTSAKKHKYETKAARLAEKKKQRTRKLEKAARAGGKQSRPKKHK